MELQTFIKPDRHSEAGPPEPVSTVYFMRLMLALVDLAGEEGLHLTADSPLVEQARSLLENSPSTPPSTAAALRDLVWRIDTARYLFDDLTSLQYEQLFELLDTTHARRSLGQEP
ncbi:hypothetical protein ACFOYU_11685 [Microvirga sp. GCM10011540]|uniref:hypothetical protein n=1 Tax=Microvirga sp. GCM10011540 TaxID=3317338 RepID=UPI0036088C7C